MACIEILDEGTIDERIAYFKNDSCSVYDLHREDGPAVEYKDGTYKAWWLDGKRHRIDGPAVERIGGSRPKKEYWLYGKNYTKETYYSLIRFGGFV